MQGTGWWWMGVGVGSKRTGWLEKCGGLVVGG